MKRLALALALLLGCYNSHGVKRDELPNLNGYAKDHPAEVHDWGGRSVQVDGQSKVYLTKTGGETLGGHFDRIAVQGGRFVGKTSDGQLVDLLLPDISEVSVDTYSRKQTIAGYIVAGVLVVGLTVIFATRPWTQSGSCPNSACQGNQ